MPRTGPSFSLFLISALALSLLPNIGSADVPVIDTVKADPVALFARDATKVVFTAHVVTGSQNAPEKVRLLRLQGSGNEDEVSLMRDDGAHGDLVKNDGIYTCMITLKEPNAGLLSFTVEAIYPNSSSIRSHPIFMNVIGGTTSKGRRRMMRTQEHAQELYTRLLKEKGLEQARKETSTWLIAQSGVAAVFPAANQGLFVQYNSGVRMIIEAPPPAAK